MRSGHVFLLGFMGCGKTTIGRHLAPLLSLPFADLDEMLEQSWGRSISELFALYGETAFRNIEHKCLLELLSAPASKPSVIALGGGTFAQPRNRDAIKRAGGVTVFLDSPVDVLLQRCAGLDHRPLARDPDAFVRLYQGRLPLYRLAAVTVGTGSGTPEEAAAAIAALL